MKSPKIRRVRALGAPLVILVGALAVARAIGDIVTAFRLRSLDLAADAVAAARAEPAGAGRPNMGRPTTTGGPTPGAPAPAAG
jgi:hypothetical protein